MTTVRIRLVRSSRALSWMSRMRMDRNARVRAERATPKMRALLRFWEGQTPEIRAIIAGEVEEAEEGAMTEGEAEDAMDSAEERWAEEEVAAEMCVVWVLSATMRVRRHRQIRREQHTRSRHDIGT